MAKKGFRALPPLDLKEGFDLKEQRLFFTVLGLVQLGKVKMVWVSLEKPSLSLGPLLFDRVTPGGLTP